MRSAVPDSPRDKSPGKSPEKSPGKSHCQKRDALPGLDQCGYDWIDSFTLEIIRWLCVGYSRATSSGFEQAFARADAVLGQRDGPCLVAGVTALMTAIRRGRNSSFEFSDPVCPGCRATVLPHEEAIMSVVRAGRRDDEAALLGRGLLLLEGNDPALLTAAARRLGGEMERIDADLKALNRRWKRPAPRPLADRKPKHAT